MTSKLVIADGHHRYETALNFRNECRESAGKSESEAPYEFVMMTFVNINDPGLFVSAHPSSRTFAEIIFGG